MRRRSSTALGALLALAIVAGAAAPPCGAAPAESGAKVNINTAGIDELVTLPGIGRAYAQRIIEYRDKNGPFKRVEDLLNVRGIGEKTFAKIKDRLTVGKN
jgi:competence protein ComEA